MRSGRLGSLKTEGMTDEPEGRSVETGMLDTDKSVQRDGRGVKFLWFFYDLSGGIAKLF
jgi:hypothetical protein